MRVLGDIAEKSLDIAVIIPSYREADGILDTLESLADQQEAEGIRFAIFIVINNARDTTTEVLKSNQHTLELAIGLQKADVSDELALLDDEKKSKQYVKIKESKLPICIVDMFSEEHAPEECNVGMARDIGSRVAFTHLKTEGVLVLTDADAILPPKYICRVQELFQQYSISAATGCFRTGIQGNNQREVDSLTLLHDEFWRTKDLIKNFCLKSFISQIQDLATKELMPGSNMIVRRDVFENLGGIPHIAGGEDMVFSLKLLNSGKNIVYDAQLEIEVQARVSDRTHQAHGMGQEIKRLAEAGGLYNMPTMSLGGYECYYKILFFAQMAHSIAQGNIELWRTHFMRDISHEYPQFSDVNIDVLENAYVQGLGLESIADNPVFEFEARQYAKFYFPEMKFGAVVEEATDRILQQEHMCLPAAVLSARTSFQKAGYEFDYFVTLVDYHELEDLLLQAKKMLANQMSPELEEFFNVLENYFRLFFQVDIIRELNLLRGNKCALSTEVKILLLSYCDKLCDFYEKNYHLLYAYKPILDAILRIEDCVIDQEGVGGS